MYSCKVLFAALAVLGLSRLLRGDVLPLVADGNVGVQHGTQYHVVTDSYCGIINQISASPIAASRIAMEFDLGGLLEPETATLRLCHLDGQPVGRIYAYPGNGAIGTSDFPGTWREEVGGITMTFSAFIGNIGGPSGYHFGYGIGFDVDVTTALSLAYEKGWNYLGLLLTHDAANPDRHFALAGVEPNHYFGGAPPMLSYTPVPEPGCLLLLGLGGTGLFVKRKVLNR